MSDLRKSLRRLYWKLEDVIDPDARDIHFFRPEAGFGFAFDESFQFVSAPELYPTSSFARRSRARM